MKERGHTNLSGGLLAALEALYRVPGNKASLVESVLLFTDGKANVGIRDQAALVKATKWGQSTFNLFTHTLASLSSRTYLHCTTEFDVLKSHIRCPFVNCVWVHSLSSYNAHVGRALTFSAWQIRYISTECCPFLNFDCVTCDLQINCMVLSPPTLVCQAIPSRNQPDVGANFAESWLCSETLTTQTPLTAMLTERESRNS